MEKYIRISKKQQRKIRKQVTNEELKKQRQNRESIQSSEGKVMIGQTEQQNPETKNNNLLQSEIEQMKTQIAKYEEIFHNQGEKIRELMNCIEDQNKELLILKSQLIKNSIVTENNFMKCRKLTSFNHKE